jgi:hypothetical protein
MEFSPIDVTGLDRIGDFPMPVYASPGGGTRVRGLAQRAHRVLDWLGELVELPPIPPLFVLDPADWDRIALTPHYGLAHTSRTRTVMGQQQSGLWANVANEVWSDISAADRQRLEGVYGTPPDLSEFADLVIAHELTHLADRPSWLDDDIAGERCWGAREPRLLWLNELFANLGMQGYISQREPESLLALETVFEVIGAVSPDRWRFRRLSEMYESATAPGMDGTNYVWFEFRLQILAQKLWQAAGTDGFLRLHSVLHGPILPHEAILDALAEIDETVAGNVSSDFACT